MEQRARAEMRLWRLAAMSSMKRIAIPLSSSFDTEIVSAQVSLDGKVESTEVVTGAVDAAVMTTL